jgi:ABC-type antimicrobial peptide transport system permease subunit
MSISKRKEFFSWLGILIGIIVVLGLIFVIISIGFCVVRYRKQKHFKSVPVYV